MFYSIFIIFFNYCLVRYNNSMTRNPTESLYQLLREAYDHFNGSLFAGKLPQAMLTLQRNRNTMGYFSADRWVNGGGQHAHEIALNPAYFARHRVIDVLQTLVHEQCHLWQHVHGRRRSRSGYHNREWADKMESIGLIPSSTGQPGGNRTGQNMSDYPAVGGDFIAAARELSENSFRLEWIDTEPAWQEACQPRGSEEMEQAPWLAEIQQLAPALLMQIPTDSASAVVKWSGSSERVQRNKRRYSCSGCGAAVWGKPGLDIRCGKCELVFQEGGIE